MRYQIMTAALAVTTALPFAGPAAATDLEVTHWWTSGGEAAAVAEFAKAFDATGNHWVDGAIAGSGGTARPIMISRITGGDPMGATQFNHGRQAEELVQAGLMRDLTELATRDKWAEIVQPKSLLDGCTLDGKIYCVPVNIHSWQWLWLSNAAFEKAGVPVPKNWNEYVAAAPALEKAGIIPLAVGGQPWQSSGAFDVLLTAVGGTEAFLKVYRDKDAEFAAGPEVAKVFKAADDARKMAKNTNVQDWNQATNLVISGKAGKAGIVLAGGLPGNLELALRPIAHDLVAFNLKKGSLPVRGDIDLKAANDCMKKGLDILAKGSVMPWTDQLLSQDTQKQKEDLFSEFFAKPDMTVEEAQKRFADIVASAD
ncbi:MAG: carbohydrate ABC transporter substrate-binding protein [Mesorhizobium sp.]|nr:MAG: carbohydrate ABC transporter substrate-binding protein [Mesorhizobium sp.]